MKLCSDRALSCVKMKIFFSSSLLLLLIFKSVSRAEKIPLSIDINSVTIIKEEYAENNSMFGYTTSLAQSLSTTSSGWVFVGAPRSNVSTVKKSTKNKEDYFEPGVVWRCNLGGNVQKCEILHFLHQLCKDKVKNDNFGECDSNLMGASLVFKKGVFVACAPTWTRIREAALDKSGLRMDGACYWMRKATALSDNLVYKLTGGEKSSTERRSLIPFQDELYSSPRTSSHASTPKVPRWFFAEAGFSVDITNSKDILLGAPRTRIQYGSMLKVKADQYTEWGLTNSETYKRNPAHFENFGYAVTSGNYLDEITTLYAASSPFASPIPSAPLVGVILIIGSESFLPSQKFRDKEKIPDTDWQYKHLIVGKNFGGYFGATIESIDINGDGLDEMLVGSPLTGSSDGDISENGCVFIYTALGKRTFTDPAKTICGEEYSGRFGTSIAKLGDLNQDGFNDFAVGAPFGVSGGAVYVYYGDKDLNLHKHVIRAEDYKPHFTRFFGFSITGDVDLDGNYTPDLCIGSFFDKQVAIFRTRPKMEITAELYSYVETKAENPITLEKDAVNFKIELCPTIAIKYKDRALNHANNTVIHARIVVDEEQKNFTIGGRTVTNTVFVFPALKPKVCLVFTVERENAPDADNLEGQRDVKVEYTFWYNLTSKNAPNTSLFEITNQSNIPKVSTTGPGFADFCPNCPNPIRTDPVPLFISFRKDCRRGNENGSLPICLPQLHVNITGRYGECANMSHTLSGMVNKNTLGDSLCIDLFVRVRNSNQTAYSPRIKLSWGWTSSGLSPIKLRTIGDVCTINNDNTADCKLDSVKTYLGFNQTRTQIFRFASEVSPTYPTTSGTKRFEITGEVDLESDKTFKPISNKLTIDQVVNAGIDLLEGSLTNISYPVQTTGQLNYNFKVRVAGITPVRGTIILLLPTSVNWMGRRIEMFTIQKPWFLTCTDSSRDDPVFANYGKQLPRGKGSFGSLYDKSNCQALNCKFLVTKSDRFLDLRFDLKLRDEVAARDILLSEGAMDFYGMAYAKILDLPAKTNVTRMIINPPPKGGLESWKIILAGCGGLLVLFLIVLTLWKCGFFKRNVKKRLEDLKAEVDGDFIYGEIDHEDAEEPNLEKPGSLK